MIAGKLDRASLHKICAYIGTEGFLPVGVAALKNFSPVSSSGKLSLRHPLNKLGGEFFFDETFGDDATLLDVCLTLLRSLRMLNSQEGPSAYPRPGGDAD
jgi:hypothetical protein